MAWSLSAAVCAQEPSDLARRALSEAVAARTATVDHIATIGGYEYEVYVDRSVVPPVAVATITSASMDRLLATPQKGMAERMTAQHDRVSRYLATLTGRPVVKR
ncbi:hypothetical protein KAK07_08900 [Ideonella sp. 4Y16]|uniref:Uncharacterized protein n=1 Tax=Ideonella alba TaxID=2824118 RepID=A0A940YHM4_9BURK|nr:hypothetical protein [Ideonella alba]MBQ0932690.1 hypothetical protein [Ideonella alba]MBQ0943452.1 hypothetical protein [Ideonella alba]